MTYYTDNMCTMGAKAYPADGSCNASGTSGADKGYIYTGALTSSGCKATPGAPANVTLQSEQTVCCAP